MPVLVIDNVDSFVFNLARYVEELGCDTVVARHDALTVAQARALDPSHIILSPGPMGPEQAGISQALVRDLGQTVPLLGVCLGHQCIGAVHGGRIVRAAPVHGRPWPIRHAGQGLFAGLPNPFAAARYHSLVVDAATLPAVLLPLAWAEPQPQPQPGLAADGAPLLMAFAHRHWPQVGVQFHPESIGSEHGHTLLARFLAVGDAYRETGRWAPAEPVTLTAPAGMPTELP